MRGDIISLAAKNRAFRFLTCFLVAITLLPLMGVVAGQRTSGGGAHSRTAPSYWTGPWNDARNTNYINADPAGNGGLYWEIPIGGINGTWATVSGDRIFVGKQYENNILYCLDRSSGNVLWYSDVEKFTAHTPIVSDIYVYSPGENTISAYRISNGSKVWTINGFNGLHQPLLDSDKGLITTDFNDIRIYDPLSGQKISSYHFNTTINEVPPAVDGNMLFLDNGSITAFDLTNNTVVWSAGYHPMLSDPIVAMNGFVIFQDPNYVIALRESDGELAWKQRMNSRGDFSTNGSSLFLTANMSQIFGLDLATGRVIWAINGIEGNFPIENTVVMGDTLFVGIQNSDISTGILMAIDTKTGETKWSYHMSNDYLMKLSAAPGMLILVNKYIRVIGNIHGDYARPTVSLNSYGDPYTTLSGPVKISGMAKTDYGDRIMRLELKLTKYHDQNVISNQTRDINPPIDWININLINLFYLSMQYIYNF